MYFVLTERNILPSNARWRGGYFSPVQQLAAVIICLLVAGSIWYKDWPAGAILHLREITIPYDPANLLGELAIR